MGLFGALVTIAFGNDQFERFPWLFGIGVVIAAGVNWYFGRRYNKRPIWFDWPSPKKNPLLARNTFCFVAMDYWSIPMLAAGVFLIGRGLLRIP